MQDIIDEGGYSKIYKARKDQKIVSIKIMRKALISAMKIEKFVMQEIASLQHSQQHLLIADLFETIEDKTAYYLIMEYAPNGSLLDHVNNKEILDEAKARKFFKQILE